jgi:hypothetical protein
MLIILANNTRDFEISLYIEGIFLYIEPLNVLNI